MSLASLLALMSGEFRSTHSPDDATFGILIDRRTVVQAPLIGDHVMYWQVNRGMDGEVYRQRLLSFAWDDDTSEIVQKSWAFHNAEPWVDAFESSDAFRNITLDDVTRPVAATCLQRWRRTENGWIGTVDPGVCRIWSERREAWRRIESIVEVSDQGMWLVERGFDDDMNLALGTPLGERLWLERVR